VSDTRSSDPVASAYDRWASAYDGDANATRDLDAVVLRQAPFGLHEAEVLELGCGTGKNTEWLAQRARCVLALDFSDGMLERARARLGAVTNVGFLAHDLRRFWPVPDGSQDRVIGNLVLEHIEMLEPIFTQAARVLRPRGLLYSCELHPFRQLQGKQAQFLAPGAAEPTRVPAYVHDVSDYVAAGLAAGLVLEGLFEWRDPGEPRAAIPRLLAQLWRKPG
jgi:ubiquinone/menaquinone biosynthesis C-methylase UbiE